MKIETIRIKRNLRISEQNDREVKSAIIIISLFCASMIIGAGIFRINDINSFDNIFELIFAKKSEAPILKLFFNSISVNFTLLFTTFFCGLSCFGLPIISAIPILQGLGYGIIAGFLIKNYSFSGMGYYLLIIFPSALIIVTTTVLSCCNATVSSFDTLSTMFAKSQSDSSKIIHYIRKFLILSGITVIAALIDAILTKSFSHLFIF